MDIENVVYKHNGILLSWKNITMCTIMMDLEGITLSEMSQRKTNTTWLCLYIDSKKQNKMKTDSLIKQTGGF